jgi:hypothetical protein
MTRSMSKSRWRRMAIAIEAGMAPSPIGITTLSRTSTTGPLPKAGATAPSAATPTAHRNHLSCWRSARPAPRKRTTKETRTTPIDARKTIPTSESVIPIQSSGRRANSLRICGKRRCSAGEMAAMALAKAAAAATTHTAGRQRGDGGRPVGKTSGISTVSSMRPGTHIQNASQPSSATCGSVPGAVTALETAYWSVANAMPTIVDPPSRSQPTAKSTAVPPSTLRRGRTTSAGLTFSTFWAQRNSTA